MTHYGLLKRIGYLLIPLAFVVHAHAATDISTVPLNTYEASSSIDVKPNILFVLDDSGSMDWDFMPDWACASYSTRNPSCGSTGQDPSSARSEFLFRNSGYNGMYYNPAVVYKPPVAVDETGATNTTTYPRMTGTSAATGANNTATPNWKAVRDDAYGVQSDASDTSNLETDASKPPYFFTFVAGEYCDSASLRTCITANAPTGNYTFPATVRWCNSSALTTCRAAFSSSFKWVRAAAPRTATIAISGLSSNSAVTGITINGLQVMAGSTGSNGTSANMADDIVEQINLCSIKRTGNCQVAYYRAVRSGNSVLISAPGLISNYIPSVQSNSGTFTVTRFPISNPIGENLRTTITPAVTSYPYPGTSTKAASRTDCAGTTCTYAEEMTNYANWWTYYKSRMQAMKTAASNAFAAVDTAENIANDISRFRFGYMSLNNNTGNDFLNLGEFRGAQKFDWYTRLINADPANGTPLRVALSDAGRLYAGKLNGETFNGTEVTDPVQYSCQQNYTILSTDGFWNGDAGYTMAGVAVGNRDAHLVRPYYDGGSTVLKTATSRLQTRPGTAQPQRRTSTLQRRLTVTAESTSLGQQRTSANGGTDWSAWQNVSSGSCAVDSSSSTRTQCRVPISTSSNSGVSWTSWSWATGCTTDLSGTSQTKCSGSVPLAWTNVTSCTADSTTECRYTAWTSWANAGSCTALPQSTGPAFTVGTAVDCQDIAVPTSAGWTFVPPGGECTASSTKICGYAAWSSWSTASSCVPVLQSAGPNYTVVEARDCDNVNSGGTSNTLADVAAYYYSTDLRSDLPAKGTGTCVGPIIAPANVPNDLCENNVPESGRDVAKTQHMTTFTLGLGAQGQMIGPEEGKDYWTETSGDFHDVTNGTTATSSAGICSWQSSGACNWPTPAADSNANIDDLWHAAVNGHGTYFSAKDPDSLSKSLSRALDTIDNTPRPGTAAAAASSNPNVSASDNFVFSSSYRSVEWYGELIRQQIRDSGENQGTLTPQSWSAMRLLDCATTNWTPTTSYEAGAVYKQGSACYTVTSAYNSGATFNIAATGDGGHIRIVNADENATTPVAVQPLASRTIYTRGTTGLIPFQWASLSTTQRAFFTKPAITHVAGTSGLSQFCASGPSCLTATEQNNTTIATGGIAGEALVEYLRGDRSRESTYFRKRTHVLGDIVSSEARYVKAPLFNYTDTNYGAYKTLPAIVGRRGAVYVGSNDGMLHAFDAENGQELWAYIPSMILPNLYKLADKDYEHQYYVDGSPEVGEICPNAPLSSCTAAEWRTILVGGLNRGGKAYYALDVTDPTAPTLLWEFTDANLGYSYGNPRITKLKNGTWVVLLTSGYNNANGVGKVYVVNAATGVPVSSINSGAGISTGVGSPSAPSGLARLSAHAIDALTNNTTIAAYGGDLLGNLWRFDINGDIGATGHDAQRLASFTDAADNPQPITVRPLEVTIAGKPVVYAGTGRYLGTTDVTNGGNQSFYAVMDRLTATPYENPRTAGTGFVRQTLTDTLCPPGTAITVCIPDQIVRTSSSNAVDWNSDNGWYMDFLTTGERSVTDPALGLGTLLFTTITPGSSVNVCGKTSESSPSFVYALNYLTGGAIANTNGVVGVSLGSGLVTRPVMIKQSDGTVRALIRTSTGATSGDGTDQAGTIITTPPISPTNAGVTRRVSWRELTTK